jgi:predicted permease
MSEHFLRELGRKIGHVANRRQFESDLEEEMRFHLEMKTKKTGDRDHARRQFGNVGILKEVSREMWGWSSVERLFQDLRYAVRQLARNPGFTAVAVLSLALGIGANTAIFSMIDHVMLRALPVSHPEELMTLGTNSRSYPIFEKIRDRNQVFSAVMGSHRMPEMEVLIDGVKGRAMGELVSGNMFPELGVGATIGRVIVPEDDREAESGPVAVISHAYWMRTFAGSVNALGKKIQVRSALSNGGTGGLDVYDAGRKASPDGASLTIVGVAAPSFTGIMTGQITDIWIPMTMQPAVMPGRPFLKQPNATWVRMLGRRKPGISEAQARASVLVTWRQILTDEAGSKITEQDKREIAQYTPVIESGEKGFGNVRRDLSKPLFVLMAVVGLVLLIACLNVANLLLARATARRKEITVRLSMGASRVRLIRQLLTESLVLALAGAAAGVLCALAASRLLITLLSSLGQALDIPFQTDWRTLSFTAGVAMLTGLLFGLAPAIRATRVSLAETLKDASRGAAGSRVGMAKGLVAVQVAVSMLLLVGSGLFLRTLANLKSEDLGFNPDGLVMMRVDPVSAGYRGDEVGRSMQALLERVRAIPGVRLATFSENGLFSGSESGDDVDVEGFTAQTKEDRICAFDQAGPQYFTNVGIPILLGRDLNERDLPNAPRVAVINESMAKFYFKGASPIGKHFTASKVRLEIVGVVRDVHDHDHREAPYRRFYVSYFQPIDGITTANFEVRTAGNSGAVMTMLRSEVSNFNRNLPILHIKEERDLMDRDLVYESLLAKLSAIFAALAIVLATIGLYGVMSYAVSRRTNELGIRMALGAAASTVRGMVLRESLLLIGAGAVIGIGAALGLTRLIKSFLYGLSAMDPISFGAAALLLIGVGALAGYLPARRASKIDPMIALRYE